MKRSKRRNPAWFTATKPGSKGAKRTSKFYKREEVERMKTASKALSDKITNHMYKLNDEKTPAKAKRHIKSSMKKMGAAQKKIDAEITRAPILEKKAKRKMKHWTAKGYTVKPHSEEVREKTGGDVVKKAKKRHAKKHRKTSKKAAKLVKKVKRVKKSRKHKRGKLTGKAKAAFLRRMAKGRKKHAKKKRVAKKHTKKRKSAKKRVSKKANPVRKHKRRHAVKKHVARRHRRHKTKKHFLSNPIGGLMKLDLRKFTGHDMMELGGLVVGGATYGVVNNAMAKYIPSVHGMLVKIPVVGTALPNLLVGVLLNFIGDKKKIKALSMVGAGMVGSAVVGMGVNASTMIPGLSMAGIDFTPNMGEAQLGSAADFGAIPAGMQGVDYTANMGEYEPSHADFGGVPEGMGEGQMG